ncbi:YtxH domain-containing protein [Lactiplantibacillus plantarum]|uniref:YtxH domain-containing protein n=1 Tax=Lactiplantibacillus plantarum TaxID=1590 RepID=UPI000DF856A5|nr:YtxH domain-containing protein [Lactiplantibacillus plantarum]MCK8472365.1 YtxH domain-containing protein [Lactiplantibacillus plantarum]QCS77549.1 YtxH domain-containing protein [Lactiplantibacillus plantarum subsp. plantarum]RDD79207.1 YtxH domain-containing protein [Lactiplantibacillus plantarum]
MSKKGFLLVVVLGGAAIATAVMKMDDDKKAELKAKAQQGIADFKNRAIDYAFYANDAAEDFKAEAGQQFEDTKRKVADFADQYQAAKQETGESFGSSLDQATDSLRSELAKVEDDEDIVIDGGAAYQKAGEDEKTSAPVPESAPAKDATPAKSNDESTTDESSPAK